MDKKILFYGCGEMGESLLSCLLRSKCINPENVHICEHTQKREDYLAETYGVKIEHDPDAAAAKADVIIIAVLPKGVEELLHSIAGAVRKKTVMVSIAAGIRIASMESVLGRDKKIVRLMPNTLNRTGHGCSALCPKGNLTAEDLDTVRSIAGTLGRIMEIDERMFDAFTAFCCSGPMWICKLASELTHAGETAGFSKSTAQAMVFENIAGVAGLLLENDNSPEEIVEKMCSPGGVTAEGLMTLEDRGFNRAIADSVRMAIEKAEIIGS